MATGITYQPLYGNDGAFQCMRGTNPDGSQFVFGPGSSAWAEYLENNPLPPSTGIPTFPAPPLPANIQTAIARFQQFKQSSAAAQNALTGAQIGALFNSVIDSLNYLNNQIKNS